ncbi:hypothetical protein K501DRAFT_227779, partial [Backusella circina FSU 941]
MVRFKNRWILFEIVEDPVLEHGKVTFKHTSLDVSDAILSKTIRDAIELNYGSFGRAMLQNSGVKWYNATTRTGIIRVPRDYTDMYLSTMFFMKQIGPIPCSFSILHVSGTIIHIQKEAIERDRRFYLREKERIQREEGKTISVIEKIETSTKQIQAILAD